MTTHYRTPRSGLLCAALATLMAGCAVGPDFVRPPASTSQGYDQTSTPTQLQMVDAAPDNWWQQFQSAQLDHLVDTALRNNPGLTAAEATLRQSEAERRAGIGLYFPNLSLGLNAQRELSAPAKLGVASAGSIFNLYALGATVSYTVDLFGGNRRTVEALTANVDYSRYRLNAARLALAGNVVDTALAHAAYDEQVAITQRMVAAERTQLQLIAAQVQAGVLPKSTELAAQSLLDGTVANLPALQEKAAASRHLLATLLNSEPAEAQPPLPCWSDLQQPAALPLTLPSTLVRQRPDILAAEASLHAATANVGVATANLFPSLTLGASGGWVSNEANKLGSNNGRNWAIGPTLDVPLFAGGADIARRDSALAGRDVAIANYRQTVLAAFQQVADVLTNIQRNTEAAAARTDALRAAVQNLALTEANRRAGTLSEYDYLTSAIALDSARLAEIDANAQRMQDAVALYTALGGGWPRTGDKGAP